MAKTNFLQLLVAVCFVRVGAIQVTFTVSFENNDAKLSCRWVPNIDEVPMTVELFKNNELLKKCALAMDDAHDCSDSDTRQRVSFNVHQSTMLMYMKDIQTSDKGEYTCLVILKDKRISTKTLNLTEDLIESSRPTPMSQPSSPALTKEQSMTTNYPSGPTLNKEQTITTSYPSGPTPNQEPSITTSDSSGPTLNDEQTITTSYPSGPTLHQEQTITTRYPSGLTLNQEQTITTSYPSGLTPNQEPSMTTSDSSGPTLNDEPSMTTSDPSGPTLNEDKVYIATGVSCGLVIVIIICLIFVRKNSKHKEVTPTQLK